MSTLEPRGALWRGKYSSNFIYFINFNGEWTTVRNQLCLNMEPRRIGNSRHLLSRQYMEAALLQKFEK